MTLPVGESKCAFRDPIHGMIHVNAAELDIINRAPFQRLRYIRQLGTTYKVYHGAEHTRFGHSLGVMFLVSKAMDKLRTKEPLAGFSIEKFNRIKQLIRLVGLMHDLGHAPFSHVAEELFPNGQSHEKFSREIIQNFYGDIFDRPEIKNLKISSGDITSLLEKGALDKHLYFLNNLIDGQLDADKMDYLLRDSYYCGVNYGRYDLERLLDTLVICKTPDEAWILGVESDGVHAVEEFIFARYWMFIQVYFHKTRRILDHFLVEYMKEQYQNLPPSVEEFIKFDDNRVLMDMASSGSYWAQRLKERKPLKEVFVTTPLPQDVSLFLDLKKDFEALVKKKNIKPEHYYIDQALGSTCKEQVKINLFAEDGDDWEEQKIPAIPVLDKHGMDVRPIQEYSLPISGITDMNINLLRIYADTTQAGLEDIETFLRDSYNKHKQELRKWGGGR